VCIVIAGLFSVRLLAHSEGNGRRERGDREREEGLEQGILTLMAMALTPMPSISLATASAASLEPA
jgi:hypothetical protein